MGHEMEKIASLFSSYFFLLFSVFIRLFIMLLKTPDHYKLMSIMLCVLLRGTNKSLDLFVEASRDTSTLRISYLLM